MRASTCNGSSFSEDHRTQLACRVQVHNGSGGGSRDPATNTIAAADASLLMLLGQDGGKCRNVRFALFEPQAIVARPTGGHYVVWCRSKFVVFDSQEPPVPKETTPPERTDGTSL